jgi:hypothetical protein
MPFVESLNEGGSLCHQPYCLDSMDIYIILGMDCLSKRKVPIDCAKKSVKLTTLNRKELSI